MTARRFGLMLLLVLASASSAHAATAASVKQIGCNGLAQLAATFSGSGPVLLPSYPGIGTANATERALHDVAFVYDNALAGIALTACGQPAQAKRIADGLIKAAADDTVYKDGRLRNAYRSGAPVKNRIDPPGYWDTVGNYWKQDAYQVGTATGNVAWAALLHLTVYQSTHDARYLDAAVAQLGWIQAHTRSAKAPVGYEGGLYGYDRHQQAQHWKSTEHHIDVMAAARWALRYRSDAALTRMQSTAAGFVKAMWDSKEQRFFIGTLPDGSTISRQKSGLDAQVWPLLAFQTVPADWKNVWAWVNAQHRSGAGYGFSRNPDGIWTEGTAQVASALRASNRTVPDALWQLLADQRAGDGLLYATPQPRIRTDLAIGPDSTTDDFFYYHQPHLGATAWAALAGSGWNPFTGRWLDTGQSGALR